MNDWPPSWKDKKADYFKDYVKKHILVYYFMLPWYTVHPYSVNSPASTQANPPFASGMGSQSSTSKMGGKGEVIARANSYWFLIACASLCHNLEQLQPGLLRIITSYCFSTSLISPYPVRAGLALESDTVTCSPFHGGRWCISHSFFLH